MKTIFASTAAMLLSSAAFAADLTITPFVANEGSLFRVASSLIEGPTEVILVDAQFEKDDAKAVVEMIQETGKELTTVYISHKDPDFYFGLDEVTAAFPDAKIIATPQTLEGIKKSIQNKFEVWVPILEDNAPTAQIMPEAFDGTEFFVDGESVQIIGLDGHDPVNTFLWIPSESTVVGGVSMSENMHIWMADNQTAESRGDWRSTMDQILALNPGRIIPGHVIGESAEDRTSIDMTKAYMDRFMEEAGKASDSSELIEAMKAAYPDYTNMSDLELSAKVIMGERSWP